MGLDAEATERMMWRSTAAKPDWNAVFTEQLPRVYNYFGYRLDNEADIQELTARTFEKAWRARHRYRRELAGFGTWLLRIAHNVAIDHLRVWRATSLPSTPLTRLPRSPARSGAGRAVSARQYARGHQQLQEMLRSGPPDLEKIRATLKERVRGSSGRRPAK
jgi:RNA polymerase sigma factor (sigma-70 family)